MATGDIRVAAFTQTLVAAMLTLGINAVFHDPAACLVRDGVVVAAAEEERFTRIKHGKRAVPFSTWELPFHAIEYCLRASDVTLGDLDHVAYSFDPAQLLGGRLHDPSIEIPLDLGVYRHDGEWLSPWDPLFLSSIVNAPRQLVDGPPLHLRERFRGASWAGPYTWHFVDHHLAHAASAFLASPYADAAVMALDGRGERATTSYWRGHGSRLDLVGHVDLPHSLGLLYEDVTAYLGFLRSSDEYKVMALASYGTPRYAAAFRDMITMGAQGQYTIDDPCLAEWFGPARERGGPLVQAHFDIARSLQLVLEESVIELARWVRQETGSKRVCLAGGVALNCVMNARLRDAGVFEDVWVQPAAGDAGTALGAALWVDARQQPHECHYHMEHAYLGPSFGDDEIEAFIKWSKLPYRRLDDVAGETAEILARGQVIGWFQGRMEFGPRALGARSILASPVEAEMQARLNEIKDREDFRPVAPVVLEEDAAEWFVGAEVAPFMLFVYDVVPDKVDRIPAVRHVDGTARVQTIRRDQQPLYYDLLRAFKERTGVPVLINTSFNTRGEPIVCTPRDAIESFWTSPLDALVIGSFLLEKPTSSTAEPNV
jgi:carbamoyltransferase